MNLPLGNVVDLGRYRQRRSIRRTAALAVALFGAASFVLTLWTARERFETLIRRAAALLPPEEEL